MLKSLSIRNVVLIDKLDLEWQNGFTVLSGETGAGKSILLDALGLLLGQRAETGMIRQGCDKLTVCGVFETADRNGELQKICHEHDLDFANEIMISRSLNQDGRSKIFFNDQPVTQKLLKELALNLVEIHGQFDNQGLLNPATHLGVLDGYGKYQTELREMRRAFEVYKKAKSARLNAEKDLENAKLEEENLKHWIDEFATIKPQKNELEELEQRRLQLMNSEKILENFNTAYNALNNGQISVRDCLRQAQSAISRINGILENKYISVYEVLDTALLNIEEAENKIEQVFQEVNLNQNEIDSVEGRLFALKDLARKHYTTVEELPEVWQQMENKLQTLERGENNLKVLFKDEQSAYADYKNKAKIIHEERVATAKIFDANVMSELPDLKMEKARFVTQIITKEENLWDENGQDDVCFMVSTNQGTSLGALNKIASGGELARLMLVLKVNLAQSSQVDTMIFDEVDSGIGGATAQAVGKKLSALGKTTQVLVVTHSPQVAAQSDFHYKVEKVNANGTTTTFVKELSQEQKTEEIARMLAGETISDEARAAAEVLMGG
ncbi:MAG: DNA repair protein RecN [Alphaproteobacteria bacterium]|nr:DNA repair protein RecN [Alphaproteobacteria bacterium]